MNRIAIGVWLSVALLGIVLYMLPTVMKQLFFMKEQFVARVEESKDAWKFERPTLDERFTNPAPIVSVAPASDPMGFQVGGAGGNSLESQPAPVHGEQNGATPSELQGMQMHKAPAHGVVEGYDTATGPSPAPAPGAAPGSSPSAGAALAPGATLAPGAALAPVSAPASCTPQLTYNPAGDPVYTCDGKIITNPSGVTSAFPTWLKSASTKDGIDGDEAAILNYWLTNDNRDMPGWVKDLAAANTLTDSEKKAFATWAKENTKPSQAVVKPTTTTTTTTSSGKRCKPKPKCGSASSSSSTVTAPSPAPSATQCKGPIDMGDYIRKDSIPCWACTL